MVSTHENGAEFLPGPFLLFQGGIELFGRDPFRSEQKFAEEKPDAGPRADGVLDACQLSLDGKRRFQVCRIENPHPHENFPQHLVGSLLPLQRPVEVVVGDELPVHQHLAEQAPGKSPRWKGVISQIVIHIPHGTAESIHRPLSLSAPLPVFYRTNESEGEARGFRIRTNSTD